MVGSSLADNLVRHGLSELRVIDHDRVEQHNISSQIYGESDVGVWKVEALRNHLFRTCGVETESLRKQLDAKNARMLLKDAGLIVDAFDNSRSRRFVQDDVRAAGVARANADDIASGLSDLLTSGQLVEEIERFGANVFKFRSHDVMKPRIKRHAMRAVSTAPEPPTLMTPDSGR